MVHAVKRHDDGDSLSHVSLIDPSPSNGEDHGVMAGPSQFRTQSRRRRRPGGGASQVHRVAHDEDREDDSSAASSVAFDLLEAVTQGLPGRVRDLAVRAEVDGLYVISGVVGSYYSKQMAQHLAMEIISPGDRLVNDIEVRSAR